MLLIEHKLDVVTTLADTVYVLDHGEVIAQGTPAEVRRDEEVLRAYLGRNAQAAPVRAIARAAPCCLSSSTSTPTTATCTS